MPESVSTSANSSPNENIVSKKSLFGQITFCKPASHVSLLKNNHTCLNSETSAVSTAAQQGKSPFSSHWVCIHGIAVHISTEILPPQTWNISMSAHSFTWEHKNRALLSINRTFSNLLHESTFKWEGKSWRLKLQKWKQLLLPLKSPKATNAWIRKLLLLLPQRHRYLISAPECELYLFFRLHFRNAIWKIFLIVIILIFLKVKISSFLFTTKLFLQHPHQERSNRRDLLSFSAQNNFRSELHYSVTPLDSMKGQTIVHEDTWKSKHMVALLDWSTDFMAHRNMGLHSNLFLLPDALPKTKK